MVDRVCLATRKTLGALIAKYKDMGSFYYDTYSHLYKTLVAPAHVYGDLNTTNVLKMFKIMQSVFSYELGNIFPLPPLLEI